ncbi:MAG: hypothetical protein KAR87_00010 [Candidatus Aenigmarchaeota archaeon]|nr:hypothetical protein [Candidatus Aenigmarchaeota archaeon]
MSVGQGGVPFVFVSEKEDGGGFYFGSFSKRTFMIEKISYRYIYKYLSIFVVMRG